MEIDGVLKQLEIYTILSDIDQSDGIDLENYAWTTDSSTYIKLPDTVQDLWSELLDGYSLPEKPYEPPSPHRELSKSEILSLRHFTAWKKSRGTVLAYHLHSEILQNATGTEILSLFRVKRLAEQLTNLKPIKYDMCPNSHIAYTGTYC